MEASWAKPGEVFCPNCQTGHVPAIRADGSIGVDCDHNLSPEAQREKAIAARAGDGSAVGQAIDAATVAAAASAKVIDDVADRVASRIADAVAGAIVAAARPKDGA